MSRVTTPPPPSRPTLVDYLLLLLGAGGSLFLFRLPLLDARPTGPVDQENLRVLVEAMRLPEGIILLWPILYVLQRLTGRSQPLTAGEWLLGFAWLAVALIDGFGAWQSFGTLPEAISPYAKWPPLLWYVVVVPSMTVIALLVALFGVLSKSQPPWSHYLAIALIVWPVIPLAAVLSFGKVS